MLSLESHKTRALISMKKITICADDYGLNPSVTQGIYEILSLKKINATSCMVTFPGWEADSKLLKSLDNGKNKIGLHINLTEGSPLTNITCIVNSGVYIGVNKLLIKSFTRRLNYHEIYNELEAQLRMFINFFGRTPDFIDGHQHVHHLPVIRTALLRLYRSYSLNKNATAIRSVYNMVACKGFKSNIVKFSGSLKLQKELTIHDIPFNSCFSGIYNFNSTKSFGEYFYTCLTEISDNGLIMCHPGNKNDFNINRKVEMNYFMSDIYIQDIRNNNIIIN